MRIGRLAQTLAVLLLATIALAFIYVQGVGYGVIQGRVIIGPWTPVEPPGGSHPPPEVYTSRRIILEAPLLPRVEIPMNGTGYFSTELRTGTYTLTLSNCTFLGCPRALPRTVVVKQGQTTTIEIDIDTGIR
jgi:hypothetical protein